MDTVGFEPTTSRMRSVRATPVPRAHVYGVSEKSFDRAYSEEVSNKKKVHSQILNRNIPRLTHI